MGTSMLLIPSPAWCPLIASLGSIGGGFEAAFMESRGSTEGFELVFIVVFSARWYVLKDGLTTQKMLYRGLA